MSIHNFTFNNQDPARDIPPSQKDPPMAKEAILPVKIEGHPDIINKEEVIEETLNRSSGDVNRILAKGFHTHDKGIKDYFSNILVPDKDAGFRNMDVRIAGGDKTILAWDQERRNGRLRLPVMSINRDGAEFNSKKFSPPYFPMAQRFIENGSKIELIFRPTPWTVNYSLTVWSERKTEADYVLAQILTRFNPMASWIVEDEFLRGPVDAFLNSHTNSSDIDVDAEELAKVRYDYTIKAECWIPLPTKIVPSVLKLINSTVAVSDEEFDEIIGDIIP